MNTANPWIAFSERTPRDGTEIEVANHERASFCTYAFSLCDMNSGRDISRAEAERYGLTHWREYHPPTDLPPKPLPELPEGWDWHLTRHLTVTGPHGACYSLRDGCVIGRVAGGWCDSTVPLAVIDALREAAKPVTCK